MKTTLKELKKGDFFTLKAISEPTENQVYIKGDYNRTDKNYSCYRFDDVNIERFFKASREVYIDFTF